MIHFFLSRQLGDKPALAIIFSEAIRTLLDPLVA